MGKFIIKNGNGAYRFNLLADNQQVILTSESYTTKAACKNGIASVKTNAPLDAQYEKLTAKNGELYFNLLAANKQVIGVSQMYASGSGRDNGIDSVKRNAPDAEVEETA